MAQAIGNFSTINPPEGELFTFDFVNDLSPGDSIVSVVGGAWACTVAAGTDDEAQSRMSGAATVNGTQVTQRGLNFLAGVQYILACTVNTALGGSSPLTLWAYLTCEVVGC